MFVIRRTDGAFVADVNRSGGSSYTDDLRKARKFYTREAAQRDCCGNERVVDFDRVIDAEYWH